MKNIKTSIIALCKKQTVRLTALVLALSLLGGTAVFAITEKISKSDDKQSVDTSAETDSESESISDQINQILDNMNTDKQETVYVIAKADGTVNKVIVSELLKNESGKQKINDKSDLKNIENVKDDRGYTMSGDSYVWDAQGDDVYYRGDCDKELPVSLSIDFKLNGKSVSPDSLLGKSGKLKITFNYTNNQQREVTIDGKKQNIYVPFIMLSGTVLDNAKCKNISVSNGRVLSDGNRSIAVGFAAPGMQHNLDISRDTLNIPESVTITADVTDFELETTLTLASNDFFNALDLDNIKSYDELKVKLDTLDESTKQLIGGSNTLYNGVSTLLSKSGDLINGVQTLAAGAKALEAGASELSSGADTLSGGTSELANGSSDLANGVNSLYQGLAALSENSSDLNAGAKQVFDTLLSTANTQLKSAGLDVPTLTIENYSKTLDGVLEYLDESAVKQLAYNTAKTTVTEKVNANEAAIRTQVESAVKQQVLAGVLQSLNMTPEQYESAANSQKQQIDAAVAAQMQSDSIKSQISAAIESQKQQLIEQNMQSDEVQSQIAAAVEKAKSGASSIQTLKEQLDSYNKFYQGLYAYTSGVDSAYSGSHQLKNGADKLNSGVSKLNGGANDLSAGAKRLQSGAKELLSGVLSLIDGSAKLIDGVKQLDGGANQLSSGMQKYYDEGISAIIDTFNGDIDKLVTRMRATVDVSKDYDSYGGKSDGMTSSTKFIYRTESISK
ncbi:MAG: hypothetical protein ACI396_05875 [Acutalibacteraceae bacterium]